jgi:hypothetical protein
MAHTKLMYWDMEAERLMNLCRDTGGEASPYFDKLNAHLAKKPIEKEKK